MQNRSSSSVRVFYPALSQAEVIRRLSEGFEELQTRLPIVWAVLFGSYAKGNYTVGSDIDLLIVYEGEARPDAYALVKQTLALPRLEPHLYTEAEREKLHEMIRKMAKDGIVLFSRQGAAAQNNSKRAQMVLKRLLDIAVSVVSLAILAIPFALIALAITLDSRGPVFFRQARVGQDGRSFTPLKFRTMQNEARRGKIDILVQDDPRITRAGRVLRSWGIDELPQLWNVLKGEMSLVGPRPTFQYQVDHYDERQRKRLQVKPGITGWSLIQGRNALRWRERIEYDLWYVDNWNFWLDLRILARTVWVVLRREGLYGPEGVNDPFVQYDNRDGVWSYPGEDKDG
jgi:lipopolysaccharide/colanic/teichoic acid biosynthesis glycosyltransferase